jgi:hypothetical protein
MTVCVLDSPVISPGDGHIVARNMYRKERNTLRKIVHHVGFTYKEKNILPVQGIEL